MSAFGKGDFEGSSLEGDTQNAKCQLIAPLATWLHVYSFSPVYRPKTNECPRYFRHSVSEVMQAASPVELKGAHTLRRTHDDFHRNKIYPYFSICQLWEQILFCLPFLSWVLLTNSTLAKFPWKLTEINPWFIRSQNTCKLQSVQKAETGRKGSRHFWLDILKHPLSTRLAQRLKPVRFAEDGVGLHQCSQDAYY